MFDIDIDLNTATPLNYMNMISSFYEKAKQEGISRYAISWGSFSHDMNRVLKMRRETEDLFADVFMYWQLKSDLLELENTSPFLLSMKRQAIKNRLKPIIRRIKKGEV